MRFNGNLDGAATLTAGGSVAMFLTSRDRGCAVLHHLARFARPYKRQTPILILPDGRASSMNENYHSSHGLSGTRRSLTSLQQRLVKTGGRSIKHARYYWLLLAESHQTRRLGAVLKLGRKSQLDNVCKPEDIK